MIHQLAGILICIAIVSGYVWLIQNGTATIAKGRNMDHLGGILICVALIAGLAWIIGWCFTDDDEHPLDGDGVHGESGEGKRFPPTGGSSTAPPRSKR